MLSFAKGTKWEKILEVRLFLKEFNIKLFSFSQRLETHMSKTNLNWKLILHKTILIHFHEKNTFLTSALQMTWLVNGQTSLVMLFTSTIFSIARSLTTYPVGR